MNRPDLNKAISIKQPWAYLICAGIKDVENRTWATKYRGRVYIHASGTSWAWYKVCNYLTDKMADVFEKMGFNGKWLRDLHVSAIIGHVDIVNCIGSDSIWAEPNCFHWILRNPVLFDKPILNVKGKLSFWDCSEYLIQTELQPNTTD